MKVLAAYLASESKDPSGMNVMVWPDSSIVRSGKPVFLPEDDWYSVIIGFAAKIKDVGKSIQKKFASRYYNEVLPMAFFLEENVAQMVLEKEDPKACDIVADFTVICGDSIPTPLKLATAGTEVSVEIKGLAGAEDEVEEISESFNFSNVEESLDYAISAASVRNTLKTGDFVAFILPKCYNVYPDTLLKIKFDGNLLIENKLK